MLDFIGIGSAFNTKLGNTSAFIRSQDSMILIDCGGTVFHRVKELMLLEDLKQLNIIITHTHPDHVGSLGDIIFYSYYILKITPKLYFPKASWIKTFLKHVGVEDMMYELVDSIKTQIPCGEIENVDVNFLPVVHLHTLPSFGLIIGNNLKRLYYSGDASEIPEIVLSKFIKGKIELLYQDTCGLEYQGNAHLSLAKLCKLIPYELREKVYCIHNDDFIDIDEVYKLGFKIPTVYS